MGNFNQGSLRRQGDQGSKNIIKWFERFHCGGVNALYRMSKVCSVQKLWTFVSALWRFYSNLWAHWHFCTFFVYRNSNIDTETLKCCIKLHFNGLSWMKSFDLRIFCRFQLILTNLGQKYRIFTKIRFKEIVGNFILTARNATIMKVGK